MWAYTTVLLVLEPKHESWAVLVWCLKDATVASADTRMFLGGGFEVFPISPSDSASHWSFAYYNGIVGNTSVADGALILYMIT